MYSALRTRRFFFTFITGQSQPRLSSSRRNATNPLAHPQGGGGQLPICRIFFNAGPPPGASLPAASIPSEATASSLFLPAVRDTNPDSGLAPAEWCTPPQLVPVRTGRVAFALPDWPPMFPAPMRTAPRRPPGRGIQSFHSQPAPDYRLPSPLPP